MTESAWSSNGGLLNIVSRIHEASLEENFAARIVEIISELVPGTIIGMDEIHEATRIYRMNHSYPLSVKESALYIDRLAEVYTQNPIYDYMKNGGKEPAVDISTLAPRKKFHCTDFYHDIFKPLCLEHQIIVRLERAGWITTITVNRDRPFTKDLVAFFKVLSPHLNSAHRVNCELSRMRAIVNPANSDLADLTPREAQVFHWMKAGKRNQEIALILECSHRTVEKHVESILRKSGSETRSAAVASREPG